MSKNSTKIIKILLLGETSVGKTTLMKKYTENEFTENYQASIGIDFKIKEITHDSNNYKLQIIDTAGQERFRAVSQTYFHEADGFFIIFDMAEPNTFELLDFWIGFVKEVVKDPNIIILGNKCDLVESIDITPQQINDYISKTGYQIYKVSAKEKVNLNAVFTSMIDLINEQPIPSRPSFYLKKEVHKKHKKKKFF